MIQKNIPLLERVMSHIEEHPEEHYQAWWFNGCGTAFCFAGHAALMCGAPKPPKVCKYDDSVPWYVAPGVYVDQFAREALGLSEEESNHLFDAYRTQSQLRKLVDLFVSGGTIRLDSVRDTEGNRIGHVLEWLCQ